MRTSMIGAALLLAGAGAAGLAAAAADVNGSGLQLNGSDTLFDVTNEVLGSCTTQFGSTSPVSTLSYLGGGSGVGAGQMGLGQQAVSPMSRAFKNTEFCSPLAATVYGGTVTSSSGNAEGLLLGIDGVAIVANQVMSCADSSSNPTPVTGANGFAPTSMSVLTGGTGAVVTSCNGCESGNSYVFGSSAVSSNLYKGQASFDALAVLYFGLTHDGVYSGCGSDVRKSLIAHWSNLFSTDCAAGDGVCTAGLTHAWRRSDLSGTTDAFVSVLTIPDGTDANLKGFARDSSGNIVLNADGTNKKTSMGIGTLSNVPTGASKKSNPFCNSADAQTFVNLTATPNTSATTTFGGSGDFTDLDPVRTKCGAAGTEDVCQFSSNFAAAGSSNAGGDLGVVLPILLPDGSVVNKLTDDYPATQCSTLCTLVAISNGSKIPTGTKCPGGGSPIAGACYMPYFQNGTDLDPRCTTKIPTTCVGHKGTPDFRTYNLPVIVNASVFTGTVLGPFHGNKEYQFGVDANLRILNNSFYRIHEYSAGSHYAAGVGSETGTTGICAENDDTSQIGCLTDSDPCSLGYGGREAAAAYPGAATQKTKALLVNGVPPFTPPSVSSDQDLALENLLVAGTPTPLYPLARRLYFNTIFGFGNLQGGEAQLAACMGTSTISGAAIQDHHFVKPPLGVQCVDYPEGNGTSAPPPNVNGTGNVALGGCGSGTANTNACSASPPVDVNGATVPEATETF